MWSGLREEKQSCSLKTENLSSLLTMWQPASERLQVRSAREWSAYCRQASGEKDTGAAARAGLRHGDGRSLRIPSSYRCFVSSVFRSDVCLFSFCRRERKQPSFFFPSVWFRCSRSRYASRGGYKCNNVHSSADLPTGIVLKWTQSMFLQAVPPPTGLFHATLTFYTNLASATAGRLLLLSHQDA